MTTLPSEPRTIDIGGGYQRTFQDGDHFAISDPSSGEPTCVCGYDPAADLHGKARTRLHAIKAIHNHSKGQPTLQLGITLYIAGPMSGLPGLNYPAFHHAAAQLRAAGYAVLNPAETEAPCRNPGWQDWMRVAIAKLIQADAVATLPGWEDSRGALVEVSLADGLGLPYDPIQRHLDVAAKIAGKR